MRLFVIGASQASAPLPLREQLSVAGLELEAALAVLRSREQEGFVLSTCGRTELYGVTRDAVDHVELLVDVLGKRGSVAAADVRAGCYAHEGAAAARHALRVASGLESMVVGEDQIQAQMKRAIAQARDAGALGSTLERLGATALTCGKRVRTFTALGRHAVSLESLAVRAAEERAGALTSRQVLVIGAGESAQLILRQLAKAGAEHVTVVSRSEARAASVAVTTSARARGASELPDALAGADAVFCCTSAPHPVVTMQVLAARFGVRGHAPLLCIDLGMPRDVDAPVALTPGVTVVPLDELDAMAAAHRATRREHIPAAEAIVERELTRFLAWLSARDTVRAISIADAQSRQVVEAELARALSRLQGATARDREIVTQLAHRIARKLTHERIDTLKRRPAMQDMSLLEDSAS